MEIIINTKNSTNTFNVSFAEPSETDDLIELIKQTRLIASIIWFTLAFLGLTGKIKFYISNRILMWSLTMEYFSMKFYIKNKVNGFVIFTIIKYKQLHNNTTMCYLFNLTISNISYLIFCVLITAITYLVDSWPFGSLFCKCYHYLSFVTVCSTCMSLMAMTIGIYLILFKNVII